MKKCPNCGALNNNDAKFCVNCGHDLSKVSSQQQEQPKPEAKQPQTTTFREQFNNERTQSANMNKQSNQTNYGEDVHNLLSDIKNSLGSSNGKRPWFKSLDGALAAIVILLIIIVVELGICIGNLSDIDNTVGASHNQDDDQSYVIQHHQHKMPKLYVNHHINHHEAHI